MSTDAAQDHDEATLDRLTRAADDVRAARRTYVDEQRAAWQRYVTAVDDALHDDDVDDRPIEDLVRQLLDDVHGRVDDLRVQAHLGRMELDDLASELRRAAAAITGDLRP